MPVIALVGNKGGAGKTTLTVNLAAGLSQHGSVAIVDADPQGSSLQWRINTDESSAPPVYPAEANLIEQIEALEREYAYVIADCPPSVDAPQTLLVLQVTDLALVPVQPSPVDLWATVHIERAISHARELNPSLAARLVINQLETRSTLSQLIRDALVEINVPVADTPIRRRAVYRASALEGQSVYAMGARGKDAAAELDQFINEVIHP